MNKESFQKSISWSSLLTQKSENVEVMNFLAERTSPTKRKKIANYCLETVTLN